MTINVDGFEFQVSPKVNKKPLILAQLEMSF